MGRRISESAYFREDESMSSTTGTRPASQPGGREGPAPSAGQEQGATLGLTSATGLVIGIIIGPLNDAEALLDGKAGTIVAPADAGPP
jgi:hypothetical protein